MAKNQQITIQAPNKLYQGQSGEKILFLDCDGSCGSEEFLLTYFLSSTMLYNLEDNDLGSEDTLMKQISFLQTHLENSEDDISLPKLMIIKRDAKNRETTKEENDLLGKI